MIRLAVLGILLIVFLASIDAFPKSRLDVRGKFIRKKDVFDYLYRKIWNQSSPISSYTLLLG